LHRVFLVVLLKVYTSCDFNYNQLGVQLACFENMSDVRLDRLDRLDMDIALTYLLIAYFISLDVSRFHECSIV